MLNILILSSVSLNIMKGLKIHAMSNCSPSIHVVYSMPSMSEGVATLKKKNYLSACIEGITADLQF